MLPGQFARASPPPVPTGLPSNRASGLPIEREAATFPPVGVEKAHFLLDSGYPVPEKVVLCAGNEANAAAMPSFPNTGSDKRAWP